MERHGWMVGQDILHLKRMVSESQLKTWPVTWRFVPVALVVNTEYNVYLNSHNQTCQYRLST